MAFKLARSFKKNNQRRHYLIHRDVYEKDLNEEEKAELEALQEWCRAWVDARHPLPDLSWIREKAREIGIDLPD
jgi:hypothetical protein